MLQLQRKLQNPKRTAEKVDNTLLLHLGKLTRERGAIDTEVNIM
jgi:hypothetical protein